MGKPGNGGKKKNGVSAREREGKGREKEEKRKERRKKGNEEGIRNQRCVGRRTE